MTEQAFKISRTIMAVAMITLFAGIYSWLGLIELSDFFAVPPLLGLALAAVAGWLAAWHMSAPRRWLTVILMIVLYVIYDYIVDRLTALWALNWMPVTFGAAVLAVALAFAFWPSHGRDAA